MLVVVVLVVVGLVVVLLLLVFGVIVLVLVFPFVMVVNGRPNVILEVLEMLKVEVALHLVLVTMHELQAVRVDFVVRIFLVLL